MVTTPDSNSDFSAISSSPLPLGTAIRELSSQYIKVLTRPSVQTFVEEKGKAAWGIIWVQLIALGIIDAILSVIGTLISPVDLSGAAAASGMSPAALQTIAIVTGAILPIILTPVGFFVFGGILYLIIRVFGGKGRFVEQMYTTLLFGVPLVVLSTLLSLIPGVGSWLMYVPHIYSIVLFILAMMAVHRQTARSPVSASR
jgi:uncharacterized membrane protein